MQTCVRGVRVTLLRLLRLYGSEEEAIQFVLKRPDSSSRRSLAPVAEEALVQIAPVIGLDRHLGTLETRMRQDFARIAAGR